MVNLASWRLFDRQSEEYRNQVRRRRSKPGWPLRPEAFKVGIVMWGGKGSVLGLDHFGASAPYKTLYEKFGLTVDRIVNKALEILEKLKN